jgi:predicted transcriptional regulator
MAWKEMSIEELADNLGVNASEVREKHNLIALIKKARSAQKISQAELAKKVGVTQARIAQIESGIGTANVSFDILLNILGVLGYDYKISARRVA